MLKRASHPFAWKVPFERLKDSGNATFADSLEVAHKRSNLLKQMQTRDYIRINFEFQWFTRDTKEYELLNIFSAFMTEKNGRFGPLECMPFEQRLKKLVKLTFGM